ncbi:hypothetical protein [Yoonia sp. MH D7]
MKPAEFEALLSDISACLITPDFDQWAGRVRLPFTMVTQAGPVVSFTLAELYENFCHYLRAAEKMSLDLIDRTPISCETCDDGSVIATYRTKLLSRGRRIIAPFKSSATVYLVDGVWRVSAIIGAHGHHDMSCHYPISGQYPKIATTQKTDTSNPIARKIGNNMLKETGAAIMTKDFARFAKSFSLPHMLTTFDAKGIIETEAELEHIFDANHAYFTALNVTDIVRVCTSADFDGPDTVKAMHVTQLMSGTQRVKDPYPAFAIITRTGGVWRFSKSDYAVGQDSSLTKALNQLSQNTPHSTNDAT